MITKAKKQRAIKEVKIHDKDTGSPEVQVSLLTKRIEELASHLKKHQKDNHSRRGLLSMVSERQTQMNYLLKKDPKRYSVLVRKLNLKKKG
jgi:small subunit ribosomal protein S15